MLKFKEEYTCTHDYCIDKPTLVQVVHKLDADCLTWLVVGMINLVVGQGILYFAGKGYDASLITVYWLLGIMGLVFVAGVICVINSIIDRVVIGKVCTGKSVVYRIPNKKYKNLTWLVDKEECADYLLVVKAPMFQKLVVGYKFEGTGGKR